LCLLFSFIVVGFVQGGVVAYANSNDNRDLEQQLSDSIDEQLNNLDLSELEQFILSLTANEQQLFGGRGFGETVRAVVSGEFADYYSNFFSAMVSMVFSGLLGFVPIVAVIVALAILMSMFSNVKSKFMGRATGELIHIAGFTLIAVIVLTAMFQLIIMTRATVDNMRLQMNIAFPILLTVLTAIGATASVSVYQPAVALLSGGLMELILHIIMPLFILSLTFTVIGNLSSTVKLDNFASFLKSAKTYIIGFSFTIFMAFLSIQGITAASHDGVSIRTARFAVNRYIPIVGGYLSDGFSIIIAGSVLIKNAVGLTGLILLLATVVSPILQIILFSMALKLAASVIEPIGQERVAKFLSSMAKNLTMLYVIIIAVAFMYFITVMLIIFTSNMAFTP